MRFNWINEKCASSSNDPREHTNSICEWVPHCWRTSWKRKADARVAYCIAAEWVHFWAHEVPPKHVLLPNIPDIFVPTIKISFPANGRVAFVRDFSGYFERVECTLQFLNSTNMEIKNNLLLKKMWTNVSEKFKKKVSEILKISAGFF